jgi:lysophospholipase L1-like esterase/PKD repeat protein
VGPGDTYLALGDSLTTGEEASANNDNQPGYPDMLVALLRNEHPNSNFINVGVSGETSTSILTNGQLDQAIAAIASEREAGRRVGLVTLSIGGNDVVDVLLGNSDGEVALQQFGANLETIISRLQATLNDPYDTPQCDILLMTYYNPYPNLPIPPSGEKLADIWTPRFNTVIKTVAARHNLPVAEVYARFVGNEAELTFVNPAIYDDKTLVSPSNPNFERDLDYHPRAAGHQAIAEEFLTVSGYIPPQMVAIDAPNQVTVQKPMTIYASPSPSYASEPLAYTWQPEPDSTQQASATYTWDQPGTQTITITISNGAGSITHTHTLTVTEPLASVQITGPVTGTIATPLTFEAMVAPDSVSKPITYTWSPTPTNQQATSATYTWQQSGTKTITVTATNEGGTVQTNHTITITKQTTPTLTSSEDDGAPGSGFSFVGSNLLPQAPARVQVNGYSFAEKAMTTGSDGTLSFLLVTTEQQQTGQYVVVVEVGGESSGAILRQTTNTQVVSRTITLAQTAPKRELVPFPEIPQLVLPTSVIPYQDSTNQDEHVFLPIVIKAKA